MKTFLTLAVLLLIAAGAYIFGKNGQIAPITKETENKTDSAPPSQAPALTTVDRSGQNLIKMPEDILRMTQVQHLNLSNNNITGALPAEIRHLQNLQVLNISNNKMTGLPAEVGQLSKLRILDASNNELTGIPHELGNLQNLEVLNLSGNNISEFDLNVIREKLPASVQIIQ